MSNQAAEDELKQIIAEMDRDSFRLGNLETYSLTRPIAIRKIEQWHQNQLRKVLESLKGESVYCQYRNRQVTRKGQFVPLTAIDKAIEQIGKRE